ncbi:MAG: hypothetical protein ACOY3Y_07540 [Acidobacteriota bacterium]
MHRNAASLSIVLTLAAFGATAQEYGPQPPTTVSAIKRACDVAGGLEAFRRLGIVQADVVSDEITQDGTTSSKRTTLALVPPGPLPARLERPDAKVVAGDDGTGGWAVADRRPDARPSTAYMIRRLVQTELFPLLLPFSLTWEGVSITDVKAMEIEGQPVWRLSVTLARTFFHTPQISTEWTVDFDRRTWALVRAQCPYTDLGQGIKADGMRFTWSDPVKVRDVWLHGTQRVIGLDEAGQENAHTRVDKARYGLHPASLATKLFANPIPPDLRPKQPQPGPPVKP